jgi:hypothetical protein
MPVVLRFFCVCFEGKLTDNADKYLTAPAWITPSTKLVAKPDTLIKRRGKAGLLSLNKTWDGADGAKAWIKARAGKPVKVGVKSLFYFYSWNWEALVLPFEKAAMTSSLAEDVVGCLFHPATQRGETSGAPLALHFGTIYLLT